MEPLLRPLIKDGRLAVDLPSVDDLRHTVLKQIEKLSL
jgi:hypothetical protein